MSKPALKEKFFAWLDEENREPETQAEFCTQNGISPDTAVVWAGERKKAIADYNSDEWLAGQEHKADKAEALAAMPDEHDEWDYQDLNEIKCPYCDYEFSDSFENAEDNEKDHECPRCDNTFMVTAEHSLSFSCKRKD